MISFVCICASLRDAKVRIAVLKYPCIFKANLQHLSAKRAEQVICINSYLIANGLKKFRLLLSYGKQRLTCENFWNL